MADIGSNLKNIWMKGMAAIGNTASSIANNTKFRVDEMSMVNRRAEILKDFGAKSYALWQKGEKFPAELDELLRELSGIDEKLNDMRAERIAGLKPKKEAAAGSEETDEAKAPEEAADAEEAAETEAAETEEAAGAEEDIPEEAEEEEEEEEPEEEEAEEEEEDAEPEEEEESVPVIRVEPAEEPGKDETPLSSAINDLFEQIPSADEAVKKVDGAIDSLEEGLKEFSDSLDGSIDELTRKIGEEEKE